MKSLDDLRKAFTGAGVDLTKPIVTTCGSGLSALVLTLALYRLGVRGSALYDGSWAQWGQSDGPPVATRPAGSANAGTAGRTGGSAPARRAPAAPPRQHGRPSVG